MTNKSTPNMPTYNLNLQSGENHIQPDSDNTARQESEKQSIERRIMDKILEKRNGNAFLNIGCGQNVSPSFLVSQRVNCESESH